MAHSVFLNTSARARSFEDTDNINAIKATGESISYDTGNSSPKLAKAFNTVQAWFEDFGTDTSRGKPVGFREIENGFRSRCHLIPARFGGSRKDWRNIVTCYNGANGLSN